MIDCRTDLLPRGVSWISPTARSTKRSAPKSRKFLAASWPLKGKEAELPGDQKASLFRGRAIEAGYLARSVPKRYGGSEQAPDVLKAQIIREEFFRARAPGELAGIGPSMLVPTLLEKGAEWQKEKFIGPTIRGEIVWCQGYSEPGSGSDLASLQTRGELVDGEWIINGQKIWTSGAHVADYMFCLCRTEREAPKHAGISYLLLVDEAARHRGAAAAPDDRRGAISTRCSSPTRSTPADWIVGKRGEGWIVSRTTLKHERNMIGDAANTVMMFDGAGRAREAHDARRPARRSTTRASASGSCSSKATCARTSTRATGSSPRPRRRRIPGASG